MVVPRFTTRAVAQSVVSPTADPGVANSILARSHTFDEIDHEMISIIILPLIQEGLLSVTSENEVLVNHLVKLA